MKKLIMSTVALVCVLLFTAHMMNSVFAQTTQKAVEVSKPVPADVMKIATKSCAGCHAEPGKGMALSRVNLTKWDSYSPEKQADKAKAMCNMVTKGKMPPKGFKADHPDAVPTSEDIKIICDWAGSLQIAKK
jgi:hypothetical protein